MPTCWHSSRAKELASNALVHERKLLNRDLCCCRFLERTRNDATCLGDQVSWGEASRGDRQASSSKELTA